jgi:hypothetical protein
MSVIGCRAAEGLEAGAGAGQGAEIAVPGAAVLGRYFAQLRQILFESRKIRIDDGVRPESWNDAGLPAGIADCLVLGERIERRIGGGEQLDMEALIECAGPEFRGEQAF